MGFKILSGTTITAVIVTLIALIAYDMFIKKLVIRAG